MAHHRQRGAAARGAPVQQPPRTPFAMRAVRGGHVLGDRRVAWGGVAGVARHALAAMKALDHPRGDAQVDLFAYQLIGHAVVTALEVDMVVNSPARHPRSRKGSETTSPVSITFAAPPSQSTSSARLMPTISACSSKSVTVFLKWPVTPPETTGHDRVKYSVAPPVHNRAVRALGSRAGS